MTKEVKLALILGFMVTLVVSILLSDHLSQAREAEIESADANGEAASAMFPATTRRLPPPLTELIDRSDDQPVRPRGPLGDQERGAGGAAVRDPLVSFSASGLPRDTAAGAERSWRDSGADSVSRPGDAETERRPLINFEPLRIDQGSAAGTGDQPAHSLADALERFRDRLAGGTPERREGRDGSAPVTRPASTEAPASDRADGAVDAGYWYIVKREDSLSKIARTELGNAGRWREIAEANRQRLLPNDGVRVGVRLWIPAASAASAAPRTVRGAPDQPAGTRTYTVRSGDSLSRIAARELGSASRYGEIKTLNGLTSDTISIGQELKLPGR